MTTLADLIGPLTSAEVVTSITNVATALGLQPTDWLSGDAELVLVQAFATDVASRWNTYDQIAIRGGFLDTAASQVPGIRSAWMTLLAKGMFDVDRILATFATGGWTGTNATASPIGPFNPGDLIFVCTDTGATYTNTDTVTFAPSGDTIINIQAKVIGSASGASIGRISLQTTTLGLTGSNAASLSALDDEEDLALAARCRFSYAAKSPNGPSDAYRYVALTPSLNGNVAINRVDVSKSSSTGQVVVTLAKAGGVVGSPDVTTVEAALVNQVVPDTATLTTQSASANTINVIYIAYYHTSAGVVAATERTNISAALLLAFNSFPIGGDQLSGTGQVFVDRLIAIIAQAAPKAFQVTVSLPATNVTIAASEVPVLGTVTDTGSNGPQVVA